MLLLSTSEHVEIDMRSKNVFWHRNMSSEMKERRPTKTKTSSITASACKKLFGERH